MAVALAGMAATREFGRTVRMLIGAAAAGPLVSLDLAAPGDAEVALAPFTVEVGRLFALGQPEDVRVADLGFTRWATSGVMLLVFFGMMACS
jgi:hypothetical protein